jgi:Xaa-Pro aminopeptidase
MQTLHTVLKRGGLFWDRDLLPAEMFQQRMGAIQSAVAESGDDAWLVYGDAARYGSAAYVSHFLPRTRSVGVLVPREGEASLLASVGARDIPTAKTLTWLDDVRPFTNFPRELVKLVQERGLVSARIGLVGTRDSLPVTEWATIHAALPRVAWSDRDAEVQRLREQKGPHEIAAIERAAHLVEAGLEAASSMLRPGTSIRALAAEVDRVIRRGGAEDVRVLVGVGEQSLRPPNDRVVQPGEALRLFVAAEFQRYWAEGAQTLVLGAATEAQRADAQRAGDAVQAMQAAAREGVAVGAVAEAARASLGADDLVRSAAAYGLGHGIGLDLEEGPTIRPDAAESLQSGATLGVHVVLPGGIAARTLHVTGDGAINLTTTAIEPLVECGGREL